MESIYESVVIEIVAFRNVDIIITSPPDDGIDDEL